jgi:cell wall-associated NlpC family hydrolase
VATHHAVLTHALDQVPSDPTLGSPRARRFGRLRSSFLIGATTALTLTVLPGTAGAVPGDATTPEQVATQVAEAEHQLEVLQEELNEARVVLEERQAAATAAQQAVADAHAELDALDGQIRQLARAAFTGDAYPQLNLLMDSGSADEFVSQLGTLDAIAGHTNEVVAQVAAASEEADVAQAEAVQAAEEAEKLVADIEAKQESLSADIAEFEAQYAALTAPQQEIVARAHGGATAAAVPSGVIAPSQAAQVAVDTALAQVGDRYVYGASGPDAFDCSGLTQYSYSAAGVSLPHSSRSQSQMGAPVSVGDLQPGDLLFYYSPTSHVAMYVGNGKMVHASTSSKPVMVVDFNSMSGFTHARRIAG